METNPILEEKRGKKNLGSLSSCNNGKIVLILWIEILILYMALSAIYVQGTSFQRFIFKLFGGNKSLDLQNGHKNLLQVLFVIFGDKGYSGRYNNNQKVCL